VCNSKRRKIIQSPTSQFLIQKFILFSNPETWLDAAATAAMKEKNELENEIKRLALLLFVNLSAIGKQTNCNNDILD
jgi:hypothetical protein